MACDALRGHRRELEGARDEEFVGYGAWRREGGPPFEILAGGVVAAVYGVRLSFRVMRARRLRGRTWVGPGGHSLGDDLQTRNDLITLCGRKILWMEEMGGNFKHHNITQLIITPIFFNFVILSYYLCQQNFTAVNTILVLL
jgi:hypothetical protein